MTRFELSCIVLCLHGVERRGEIEKEFDEEDFDPIKRCRFSRVTFSSFNQKTSMQGDTKGKRVPHCSAYT